MNKYSVVITKYAEQDIDDIVAYLYRQFGEIISTKYRKLFQDTCQKISILPAGTTPIDEQVFGYSGIRKIRFKKYLAFYYVDKNNRVVYVLRVKHVSMNWQQESLL